MTDFFLFFVFLFLGGVVEGDFAAFGVAQLLPLPPCRSNGQAEANFV